MSNTITDRGTRFNLDAWKEWHHERVARVSEPTGPTALVGTNWVKATSPKNAEAFPGTPGKWYTSTEGSEQLVVGVNLPDSFSSTGTAKLKAGDAIDDGSILVTAIERQGALAVRVFDRHSAGRLSFSDIETFTPSQNWGFPATFVQDSAVVDVISADGRAIPTKTAGWIHFIVEGNPLKLRVTDNGSSLVAVFADTSADNGSHPFRNIDIAYPDLHGKTFIDFNRTYLPPFAFSEHFLCPTPTSENHLNTAIEAGEKRVTWK